ncbi:MAG: DUF1566 domain-containing protein [Proteobacteria bacterium]|nr:DUF1566 domain-containing protein [Pseudomonadota bacterium]
MTNTKTNFGNVRCVRGPVAQPAALIDNGDQTLSDGATGLMWQKCSQGQSNNDCSGGSATTVNWTDALSYCETQIGGSGTFAGYSDWRLPNRNELESIGDDTKGTAQTINTSFFPYTISGKYWTSTSRADAPAHAWYVRFSDGSINVEDKASKFNYVRCVR